MNKYILEKRKVLQTLSHAVLNMAEETGIDPEEYKVNDLLMMLVYNPENEFSFNSFNGWKRDGYTIKKGAKAFLLWGQPINSDKQEDKETAQGTEEEENTDKTFFPLAFVFRSDQVLKPLKRPKPKEKPKKVDVSTVSMEIDL